MLVDRLKDKVNKVPDETVVRVNLLVMTDAMREALSILSKERDRLDRAIRVLQEETGVAPPRRRGNNTRPR